MPLTAAQRAAFIEKFGREPGPTDPVFFDPDEDAPTPMSQVAIEAQVLEALSKAGAPPEIAYAYKKTGLMGFGDVSAWPKKKRVEWNEAIEEYHAIERGRRGVPRPQGWNTQIPELLASPFGKEDLDQVRAILAAIASIEAKGMKVATRVELAAALLAMACSHAFDAEGELQLTGDAALMFEITEQVVLKRAREIYAQGGA